MKHTPTPYKTFNEPTLGKIRIIFNRDEATPFETLVTLYYTDSNKYEVEADAEFIVRACNAHDELVAALEYYADRDNHSGEQGAGADVALAALAKARGEV